MLFIYSDWRREGWMDWLRWVDERWMGHLWRDLQAIKRVVYLIKRLKALYYQSRLYYRRDFGLIISVLLTKLAFAW